MSYLDDEEKKRLAGWGQGKDAAQIKSDVVEMACAVAGIAKPSNPNSKISDLALAFFYDIPYTAEFSTVRILAFLKLLFAMTWAFIRVDSLVTIVSNDRCYQMAKVLIGMSIESLQDCLIQLESNKANYDKGQAEKRKADSDLSA
ncbi:hypothetical protein GBK02_14900 [Dechloromonas sp. TW-R-39-2]|uniref:hypothetical protein n=1 Tax=Dechloromonas sp. TW-R-39-2 TaxID=2654218 RepID=UPI00193D4D36|nr:hypothetical protein [Dechloromonas sp. TW-R-39-2]QRM20579.1 hypothetical protein GBK02_14900 [Dechloromonas sp. TW-R-39-2]